MLRIASQVCPSSAACSCTISVSPSGGVLTEPCWKDGLRCKTTGLVPGTPVLLLCNTTIYLWFFVCLVLFLFFSVLYRPSDVFEDLFIFLAGLDIAVIFHCLDGCSFTAMLVSFRTCFINYIPFGRGAFSFGGCQCCLHRCS